jgi:hypothetical protein
MMTVKKEKIPEGDELYYPKEYLYNDGYMFANCETSMKNSECYYISRGCVGCLDSSCKNMCGLRS